MISHDQSAAERGPAGASFQLVRENGGGLWAVVHAGSMPRDFEIAGQCGIPASAQAVSFNFTVTNTSGPGFLLVFPQGGAQPNASTLDYVANQTVAKGPSPRLVHLL
jgi:hypothetical protein